MAFGDFTVSRSTIKRVFNSSSQLASVAIDTPAFEFNPDGTYKGLLPELAATNLLTQSSAFDAAPWADVNVVTTAGAGTGIDGAASAAKVAEDVANSTHYLVVTTSLGGSVDSSTYTASFDLKADGRTRVQIFDNNQTSGGATVFDLSAGTIVSGAGRIEESANGFYRCSITALKDTSTTSSIQIRLIDTGTNTTYTGDGTSGVLIAFGQIETGSRASSRIVTAGATVTRTIDNINLSSASSLIGQSEGTLYCEVDVNVYPVAGVPVVGVLSVSVADNTDNVIFIGINRNTDNQIYGFVQSGGGTTVSIVSGNITAGVHKIALGYKVNDYVLYADGVQIGTDVSGALPVGTIANIHIGQRHASDTLRLGDHVKAVALFTTKLSNAQLASLTT